ncbi:MAG: hypothetical protein WCF30_14480 [Terracidiphilus sp.]
MSTDEECIAIGRLVLEHKECVDKRVRVTERVKQIADALKRLANAIDRKPDFDEVSKDSILQEYLDLSKIGALVLEEQSLSAKQQEYEERMRAQGL